MKILFGLAALATMAGAAAGLAQTRRPAVYEASGFEPGWHLRIGNGRMVLDWQEGPPVSVPTPGRRAEANGYRYVTRRMTVRVAHRPCEDEAARVHADTVTVYAGDLRFEGCGGAVLPPETLANTEWRIVSIGGQPVAGDNYRLDFSADRLSGQAGCNRFSGPYAERGDRLTAGPIMSTRMACPQPRMGHERRALQLLGGPVRISFPDGNRMVLSGNGGVVELRRID